MAVSSGDLTRNIVVKSEDEIGRVLQAVKNVNGNLRGIVADVRSAWAASPPRRRSGGWRQRSGPAYQESASALEETPRAWKR